METTRPIGSSSNYPQTPTTATLRIRPTSRRGGNLLLDLPIAGRLTLGFLTAAVIASLITGIIGVLRTQSLGRQSDFYQSLLATNTSLTTGADFLQLINTEMQQLIDTTAGPNPSKETITTEKNAIQGLTNRYDTLINQYTSSSLLSQHPDQVNLLTEGNHPLQVIQQRPLADSTLRTWHVYQAAQEQILHTIQTGDPTAAQNFWRVQGEPTNADAQSALRALILFDQRLASSVRDAANVEEQNQIISTVLGVVIAFILIILVGWFISNTLVKRLKQLRQITQAVEQGQLNARVPVIGRDEIADVAASFNAMLATIVGLLQETRQQRDALTNAADHLFSDMRVVSSGDLRVNASVSDDPIGMLANAFNFTVGRFRRFVLRTQGAVEQLDVIARQEFERSENFAQTLNMYTTPSSPNNSSRPLNIFTEEISESVQPMDNENTELREQLQRMRRHLQQLSGEGISKHTRLILSQVEQTLLTTKQLSKTLLTPYGQNVQPSSPMMHQEELHTLETLLQQMTLELYNVQKNVTKGFLEVDNDLMRISTKIQPNKSRSTIKPFSPAIPPKESSSELTRQSLGFAREMTVMAQQLTTLVHEMRTAVISFEFEGVNANHHLPLSSSIGLPSQQEAAYEFSEERKLPEGIRARSKS